MSWGDRCLLLKYRVSIGRWRQRSCEGIMACSLTREPRSMKKTVVNSSIPAPFYRFRKLIFFLTMSCVVLQTTSCLLSSVSLLYVVGRLIDRSAGDRDVTAKRGIFSNQSSALHTKTMSTNEFGGSSSSTSSSSQLEESTYAPVDRHCSSRVTGMRMRVNGRLGAHGAHTGQAYCLGRLAMT